MADGEFPASVRRRRGWEELDTDIFLKIFECFDVTDSISAIAMVHCSAVCKAWRSIVCDQKFWETLDLSTMESNHIKTKENPYVYVHSNSDLQLTNVLKASLSLSLRNVSTLIFQPKLFVPDQLFTYTAERCPKLKRLVMPSWNRITATGISKAIRCWKDLESLTICDIASSSYPIFMKEIANYCRNFRELKLMGACDIYFASALVEYLPKLEVFSLRCTKLFKSDLMVILDGLQHLQVLNISHCILLEPYQPPAPGPLIAIKVLKEFDPSIFGKASRLSRFITCMQMQDSCIMSCIMCRRTRNHFGIMRWDKYEEGLWKQDELCILGQHQQSKLLEVEMDVKHGDSPTVRRWEDLDFNFLLKIAQFLDPSDLTSAIAVCKEWRSVLCDSLLWSTIDLSMMKPNFIKIPTKPYVYVHSESDLKLRRVLKVCLSVSRGNISTLIFNLNSYVPNDLFIYTAERCRKLKRLVLPAWNTIETTGICKAIECWKELESLTIGNIEMPSYLKLMQQISTNCKNLSELKLMGTCNSSLFASTLVAYLPKLKVLSLRCSMLSTDNLIVLLDGLQDLQVLNISHCLIMETALPPAPAYIYYPGRILKDLHPSILGKASRLCRFITCMQLDSCVMCQRTKNDQGIMRWFKYEQGLWKADEVSSLAIL